MNIVLIGGDSLTITDEVSREIYKAGWEVFYAKNDDELKTALKHQSQILAVIIDNDLPVFSFPNQKIPKSELSSPKPLWILTAQKNHLMAMAHALQKGFDEFLAKPLRKEELMIMLNKKF